MRKSASWNDWWPPRRSRRVVGDATQADTRRSQCESAQSSGILPRTSLSVKDCMLIPRIVSSDISRKSVAYREGGGAQVTYGSPNADGSTHAQLRKACVISRFLLLWCKKPW